METTLRELKRKATRLAIDVADAANEARGENDEVLTELLEIELILDAVRRKLHDMI